MSAPPPATGEGRDDTRPRTLFDVSPGAHEPLADLASAAGERLEERIEDRLQSRLDPRLQARLARRQRKRWVAYAFLVLAIVSGVTGTSALSQSAGFTRLLPMVVMALAYFVCFLALTQALRVIPVGIAYAIWSGVGIALITLIGFLAFGQALNAGELAGIALILVGVVVIQLFSRAKAH